MQKQTMQKEKLEKRDALLQAFHTLEIFEYILLFQVFSSLMVQNLT